MCISFIGIVVSSSGWNPGNPSKAEPPRVETQSDSFFERLRCRPDLRGWFESDEILDCNLTSTSPPGRSVLALIARDYPNTPAGGIRGTTYFSGSTSCDGPVVVLWGNSWFGCRHRARSGIASNHEALSTLSVSLETTAPTTRRVNERESHRVSWRFRPGVRGSGHVRNPAP